MAAPLEPGFFMLNDFYYYSADGSKGRVIQGTQVEADLDMDFGGYVLTGFMVTDKELFGGRYGFGADLPIIYGSISGQFDAAAENFAFDDSRFVIGDPGVIPISLFWSFGNFHLNAYESIIVPIGQYDQDELINGGLNYWSFDTVVAGTYLHPDMGFELSAAIGYIFNTENQDIDYKTGQEFHLDYMINQFFSETFAAGLHGFYYKQTTADSGSAVIIDDFKAEAAGIGPAAMWGTTIGGKDAFVTVKWLHEYHAENRLAGNHFFVNLTIDF